MKFDFVAASDKELSLEKGSVIDLTEEIDENWLKGEYQGKSGIFPVSYVKVKKKFLTGHASTSSIFSVVTAYQQ